MSASRREPALRSQDTCLFIYLLIFSVTGPAAAAEKDVNVGVSVSSPRRSRWVCRLDGVGVDRRAPASTCRRVRLRLLWQRPNPKLARLLKLLRVDAESEVSLRDPASRSVFFFTAAFPPPLGGGSPPCTFAPSQTSTTALRNRPIVFQSRPEITTSVQPEAPRRHQGDQNRRTTATSDHVHLFELDD